MTPQKADSKDLKQMIKEEREALTEQIEHSCEKCQKRRRLGISDTCKFHWDEHRYLCGKEDGFNLAEQHFKKQLDAKEKSLNYEIDANDKLAVENIRLNADRQRMVEEIEQKVEYWTYLMSTKNAQEMWSEWQELKKSLLKGKGAEKHAK